MNDPKPSLSLSWWVPLLRLTWIRLLEFLREPEALFWTFGFPILLALALGLAFRSAPPQKTNVVITGDPAAAMRLEAQLPRNAFTCKRLPEPQATQHLRTGKTDLLIDVMPTGAPFSAENTRTGRATGASSQPGVRYRFDATRPESRIARLQVDDALQRAAGRKDPLPTHDQTVQEPGARYIDFLLPGLIGLNLMGSSMWGIGFGVVFARTRKLLKRFAATPMRRSHYLLSFIFSRLVLLLPEVVVLILAGYGLFHVQIRGSVAALSLIVLLISFSFLGLGLLLAARPTTMETVSGWMNLVMLPMWVFSGSFFSSSRFPDVLQPWIRWLPLTAANDALRMVINEGLPLGAAGHELMVLSFWCVISFFIALKIFRWQ